jgi:hypothetical protein
MLREDRHAKCFLSVVPLEEGDSMSYEEKVAQKRKPPCHSLTVSLIKTNRRFRKTTNRNRGQNDLRWHGYIEQGFYDLRGR